MSAAPSTKKPLLRLLELVVTHGTAAFWLLAILGFLGFLGVPLLERKNHFDENALLAGSHNPTFRTDSSDQIQHYYQLTGQLISNATSLAKTSATSSSSDSRSLHDPFLAGLQYQLQQQGLEVSLTHLSPQHLATFSSSSSSSDSSNSRQGAIASCSVLHAVLRSPRGDGKEALLLVTPLGWSPSGDAGSSAAAGQLLGALGLSLLSHLGRVRWLAKDVVWVVTGGGCGAVEATQAWADQYASQEGLTDDPHSFVRGGVLQQAVVLEATSGTVNHVEVLLEGYDGQLPKLDTFWLLHYYTTYYAGIPVRLPGYVAARQLVNTVKHVATPVTQALGALLEPMAAAAGLSGSQIQQLQQAAWQHVHKVIVAAQFVYRQARGLPMGPHAAFKQYGVDAATMRLLYADPLTSQPPGGAQLTRSLTGTQAVGFIGDALEATLRSCSVLVERFHHSYFLYVLTDELHFVTVERYIVPVVLLIGALLLQAAMSHQQALALASPTPTAVSSIPNTSAAATSSWPTALSLTALVHVTCLVGGLGLRAACQLWLQHYTTSPAAVGGSGASVASNNKERPVLGLLEPRHQQQQEQVVGGVLGALLVAALMVEAVRSLVQPSGNKSQKIGTPVESREGGRPDQQQASSDAAARQLQGGLHGAVVWQQVRVALLSAAAAVMTALACLNWALAYVTCIGLMPLAAATSPPAVRRVSNSVPSSSSCRHASKETGVEPGGNGGSSSSGVRATDAAGGQMQGGRPRALPLLLLRLGAWVLMSPGALLVGWLSCTALPTAGAAAAACGFDNGVGCGPTGRGSTVEQVVGLVAGSRWSVYWVACGVYLPFWLLTGLMLRASLRATA